MTAESIKATQSALPGGDVSKTNDKNATPSDQQEEARMREMAKKFEASFIAQMLKHSGLADALTDNGSKDTEAFTTFYIDQLADTIADQGGFGLAESIYKRLSQYQEQSLPDNNSHEGLGDYARSVRL